ncbi:MAG TPA: hypothetical protein VGN32_18235 [Ktedonobacterales bacterium]|nr:hypothetical protein [Ktedonobacterales bacterium]
MSEAQPIPAPTDPPTGQPPTAGPSGATSPAAEPPASTSRTESVDLTEYYALIQDTTKLSDRRQSTNDLFVGLNVLFLTGLGVVFISSHFTDWWATAIVCAIAIFTLWFNGIWIGLIGQYRKLINLRIRYLQALEDRVTARQGWVPVVVVPEKTDVPVTTRGIYSLENEVFYRARTGFGFFKRERHLIFVFMGAYLFVALSVALLTFAVVHHLLPPFQPPLQPAAPLHAQPTVAG